MGRVDAAPLPTVIELPLPWGPTVRGLRWGDAPDTVLLLHDPDADLDAWGALPARLSHALGLQAIAIDLPGHGLSDDPWEPTKAIELVRTVATASISSVRGAGGRRFVIAAGHLASAAFALDQDDASATAPRNAVVAPQDPGSSRSSQSSRSSPPPESGPDPARTVASGLGLAGLVLISPAAIAKSSSGASKSPPPSSGEPTAIGGVRASTPKLFFAGSLAGNDLETARRLASAGPGWTAVTSIPVSERGTDLLATPWRARIEEEIVAFLRDCQHRRSGVRPGPRITPRPLG